MTRANGCILQKFHTWNPLPIVYCVSCLLPVYLRRLPGKQESPAHTTTNLDALSRHLLQNYDIFIQKCNNQSTNLIAGPSAYIAKCVLAAKILMVAGWIHFQTRPITIDTIQILNLLDASPALLRKRFLCYLANNYIRTNVSVKSFELRWCNLAISLLIAY